MEPQANNDCFWHFRTPVSHIPLPESFTYPFHYTPHPLGITAAQELQQYIVTQARWDHDFGIETRVDGTNIGKMFGILVVRRHNGELGYLAAFSGKLGGKNHYPGFVPPIVDLLREDGFYRRGEDEISAINHRIRAIEESDTYNDCRKHLESILSQSALEQNRYRQAMKVAKKERDHQRQQAEKELPPGELTALKERLKNASLKWQYDYKILAKQWDERLDAARYALSRSGEELDRLREERKTKSAALQQKLFDHYRFLNSHGHTKTAAEIFAQTDQKTAPAGAGDCAAPKLLQHAYTHQMRPIALAEFWWGQSPKSEIRRHGHFYPSCRSKCLPILEHMLQGINVEPDPVLLPPPSGEEPYVVYEDDTIGVVCKPAEYLSVPGKTEAESVYTFLRKKYPHATGPMMVHRLDMSTSGLMVFAKTLDAYHHLQQQFADRTVKKRYVALLDGMVEQNEGTIKLPLRADLDDRPRQLVCFEHGKPAVTKWKVVERQNGHTRVHFVPVTGRTHQLRVHAAHPLGLNCPIAGDDLYGQKAERLCLHAEYLRFKHPVTTKEMEFVLTPSGF
ncbi:MAG: pseudouridine synthase [Breznakibacter sp.]